LQNENKTNNFAKKYKKHKKIKKTNHYNILQVSMYFNNFHQQKKMQKNTIFKVETALQTLCAF
jgi:hypothetical protein